MSKTTSSEDFEAEMRKLLRDYGIEAREILNDAVPEAADICVKMIRQDSKKATGRYARGWTKKQKYIRGVGTSYVVYNKDKYRIAHLLENPHEKKNKYGSYGFTEGDHAIAHAQEYAEEWLYDEVSKKLGG